MEKRKVGRELRALNNMTRRYFEFSTHKKEIDSITGNNGWIICYLADHGAEEICQRDIESHFTITRSTASRVLGLMERKGLIERRAVPRDARLKKIVLTDKAREVREIMGEDARRLERALTEGFTPGEVEQLLVFLGRMKENISAAQKNH